MVLEMRGECLLDRLYTYNRVDAGNIYYCLKGGN